MTIKEMTIKQIFEDIFRRTDEMKREMGMDVVYSALDSEELPPKDKDGIDVVK